MARYYGFCVLIVTCMSKSNGSTIRRSQVTENTQGFYPNNPFLNSSFPEQYQHNHYYNGHHHHHPDFYHNHNHNHNDEMPNSGDGYPEDGPDKDFVDNDYPDQFDDGPKSTTRRDVTDESIPEYPYSEIRSFLDQNPLLKQYFAEIPKLGNRDGVPDDDAKTLCNTQTVRTYHPQKLKNINQVERVIVNDKKEYKQAIEEKRCANDRGPCNIPFDSYGFTSYCHQNFDIKRLMVYENSTKKVVFDEFKVASCCVCKYHQKK